MKRRNNDLNIDFITSTKMFSFFLLSKAFVKAAVKDNFHHRKIRFIIFTNVFNLAQICFHTRHNASILYTCFYFVLS